MTGVSFVVQDCANEVIISTGWHDACGRACAGRECGSSRKRNFDWLSDDVSLSECSNGLVQVMVPITVDGECIGSIVAGQFFIDTPCLQQIGSQTDECGLNAESLIHFFTETPILSSAKLSALVNYCRNTVAITTKVGTRQRKQERVEDELRKAEDKYRLIAENSTDVIWTGDLNKNITYMSPSAVRKGVNVDALIGRPFSLVMTPESFTRVTQVWDEEIARVEADPFGPHGTRSVEAEVLCADGTTEWVETKATVIQDASGKPVGVMGVNRDITERRQVDNYLRTLTSAMNEASDQIVIVDSYGRVEFVNRAFERETGYTFDEVNGKSMSVLKSGVQSADFYSNLWGIITAGDCWHGEIVNRRKNGTLYTEDMTITPVKDETGQIKHFIAIKRDVTEKKVYQQKLDHLAHHDVLTGLPNRLLLSDRLNYQLEQLRSCDALMAVMFVDLDRFKLINDTLGHNAGDELLKKVARGLTRCLRGVDTIARMGGDEFIIIASGISDRVQAGLIAERVLNVFAEPFELVNQELFISASIGVSMYPWDGSDVETLVRNADTAMYCAKEQGRNNYRFYTEELNAVATEQMTLENGLRKAIERNEFVVMYQPQVDIATGEVHGVEALVRWLHPDYGLVSPAKFIPLAEETGLILPISEFVLRTACAQNKAWQDAGHEPISVAVNISARQLRQGDLITTVCSILDETGLDSHFLDLELTESALMQDARLSTNILCRLRNKGVRISMDDFGTGYSSLSYLKRLPIDTVKVDQCFVRDIATNPDDAAIVGAVVAMAHSLKLKVIAEGVETLEQLEFLRTLKCDEIQGYFISRPVSAEEIEDVLSGSGSYRRAA